MTELHKKTGISQNALSLLANGKSNGIQFNTLEKIIIITNSSIEDLLQYVGEQYTISVRSVAIDPIMGVPDIYDYEIIARDLENIKYSATLSFRISTEILDRLLHRSEVIHLDGDSHRIKYRESVFQSKSVQS